MNPRLNQPKPKSSPVTLMALTVLLGGVVAGGAFFQEHIASFLAQEGWNPQAAENTVRMFVTSAHDPQRGEAAAALLDTTEYQPVLQKGRLTSVEHGQAMAKSVDPVKRFAPTAELRATRAELLVRDGGRFRVLAQFSNGKWGEYQVRRVNGAHRIFQMPNAYSDEPPARHNNDY